MGFVRRVWKIQNTYSYPVPLNVQGNVITFKTMGCGGGGGPITSSTGRAGGASGGCFAQKAVSVTPGEVLTLIIPDFTPGDTDGGDVEVWRGATCLVRAKGGKKGGSASAGINGVAGIADTTGCIGDVIFPGGDGAPGNTSPAHSGGGGTGAWEQAGNDASNAGAGSSGIGYADANGETIAGNGGAPQPSNSPGGSGQAFGSGGSGAFRSTSGTGAGGRGYIGYIVVEYETITDASPLGTVAACDAFQRADADDIADSALDGCGSPSLAIGNWLKAFDAANNGQDLGILSNKCVRREGSFFEDYVVQGVPDFPMPYHGGRATLRFPTRDTITIPPSCDLLWEDTLDGVSGDIDGRAHSGGALGTGTYERVDPYTSHPAELDGSGNLIQANGDIDHTGGAWYAIRGLTGLPARTAYRLELEIERLHDPSVPAGQPKTGYVGLVKYIPAGPMATYPLSGNPSGPAWLSYASFLDGHGHEVYGDFKGAWSEAGTIGRITLGSDLDPPGSFGTPYPDTTFLQLRETSTNNITLFLGDGACEATQKAGGAITNGIFSTPGNTAGDPGFFMDCGDSWRIKAIRIYQYNPGTSGAAFEENETDILARYDTTSFSCLYGSVEFAHFPPGGPFILAALNLFTSTFSYTLAYKYIQVEHDTTYIGEVTVEQDANGDAIAVLRFGGLVHLEYNLTQETSSTNVLVAIPPEMKAEVTTGLTGIDIWDAGIPGDPTVELLKFEVLVLTETPTDPCEGPPTNPYPRQPPPPGPMAPPGILVWKNGAFRFCQDVWQFKNGAFRRLLDSSVPAQPPPMELWKNGMFRSLDWENEQPFPNDDEGQYPDYHDPCFDIDPENPDDVPPPVDVDPDPFAGGRYMGFGGMPITALGSLWNGCQRAMGPWTPSELAYAAAHGGKIMLAAPSVHRAWIDGGMSGALAEIENLGYLAATVLGYQTSGTVVGIDTLDDMRVLFLWPPSGLSDLQMTILVAKFIEVFPGVRMGIRGHPTMFARPIPGVTIYVTQCDGQRMLTNFTHPMAADYRLWRDKELARLISWGTGYQMVLHPNWLHGGSGESGVQIFNGTLFSGRYMMSPREAVECGIGFFDDDANGHSDRIIGSAGYQWLPPPNNPNLFTTQAGMTDALVTFRNKIMAMTPL